MKGKEKIYQKKLAELKIEKYTRYDQQEKDGKRIGYYKLDLSQFINKGVTPITFKMDKECNIYITAKISVVLANESLDIASMTLKSIQKDAAGDKADDESSESEDERDGAELRENFNHFYTVLKDKGIQN